MQLVQLSGQWSGLVFRQRLVCKARKPCFDMPSTVNSAAVCLPCWDMVQGPVVIYMNADKLQHYKSNVMKGSACDDTTPNHAVLLVGYNTVGNYWLVKNSWCAGGSLTVVALACNTGGSVLAMSRQPHCCEVLPGGKGGLLLACRHHGQLTAIAVQSPLQISVAALHGRGPLWGEEGHYRVAMEDEGSGDYPGVSISGACFESCWSSRLDMLA